MRTWLPVVALLALVACGDRTSLLLYGALATVDAGADAAKRGRGDATVSPDAGEPPADAARGTDVSPPVDAARASSCGAADPAEPLSLGHPVVQWFGNIAAATCSFAVTWIENRGGGLAIVARTAFVAQGNWTLSPEVTVSDSRDLEADTNVAGVGWDGTAYVVAWTAKGTLFLQRLGEDATLVGPRVTSVPTGPDSNVVWVSGRLPDGTLRIALLDDRLRMFHYRGYFVRVRPDGTAAFPTVDLTPGTEFAGVVGFAHPASGPNVFFWYDQGNPTSLPLFETTFDDLGNVASTTTVIAGLNGLQGTGYGAVAFGSETYFGIWEVPHTVDYRTLVGRMEGQGARYTRIPGVAGGDAPALAVTARGVVGALTGGDRFEGPGTNLELSTIFGGVTFATRSVAPGQAAPDSYVMAATPTSFGMAWSANGLHFTVVTPPTPTP